MNADQIAKEEHEREFFDKLLTNMNESLKAEKYVSIEIEVSDDGLSIEGQIVGNKHMFPDEEANAYSLLATVAAAVAAAYIRGA